MKNLQDRSASKNTKKLKYFSSKLNFFLKRTQSFSLSNVGPKDIFFNEL